LASEIISLAERLKERRQQLGLSQAQAARELDVARTAFRLLEMEAAKPSPDRWRLLSSWLGISVTTMLLADDLVSEEEASRSDMAETSFGRSGRDWDMAGRAKTGDFFQQGRALIADAIASGDLTSEQAGELTFVLDRLEEERQEMATLEWQPATLRKTFPAGPGAARAAREAVAFVAGDLPSESLQTARLLVTELVTNSVKHGPKIESASVAVEIEVDRDVLRVAVTDAAPDRPELKEPDPNGGGYGLTIVDRLATRWNTERNGRHNTTSFELDLPRPGQGNRQG